eukprot:CAMPEP_0178963434 /NCGR_PEP_ID=MMETSP0789-20121207/15023_1 /TAXON_ID=3005 /ORGANISM="Rhizosolenia setigera, Strain CCMP 1694" /LENGTH=297 /DNA_ID=CAMNT_0020647905 /DNA_START=18 /DNA_END=911 /DNA_ORIENTATION=-
MAVDALGSSIKKHRSLLDLEALASPDPRPDPDSRKFSDDTLLTADSESSVQEQRHMNESDIQKPVNNIIFQKNEKSSEDDIDDEYAQFLEIYEGDYSDRTTRSNFEAPLKMDAGAHTDKATDNAKRRSSLKRNPSYSSLSGLKSSGSSLTHDEHETSSQGMRRNVSFSSLSVREYDLVLGDNPSVSRGPPTSLSWNHKNEASIDLEKYESERMPRRTSAEMVMPHRVRASLLRDLHSATEVKQVITEIKKVKKDRQRTKKLAENTPTVLVLEDALESAKRKIGRVKGKLTGGSKKHT